MKDIYLQLITDKEIDTYIYSGIYFVKKCSCLSSDDHYGILDNFKHRNVLYAVNHLLGSAYFSLTFMNDAKLPTLQMIKLVIKQKLSPSITNLKLDKNNRD